MTMLIAGHETTAAVLTWTIFFLAQVRIFISNYRATQISVCQWLLGTYELSHPTSMMIQML